MELIIKPQRALRIDWRELWAYRELFYFFVWRDIKVRYKQTIIGAAWAIFQPFLTMVVFTILFSRVGGLKSHAVPYAIFLYSGLLFWNFFSTALNSASNSMLANQAIVSKIYFPRLIAPFSATIVAAVDFFFALLVFIGLMIYYRILPGFEGVLLFLPMLLLAFLSATGLGMFLAAINVKYRDVRIALPFFVQILFFVTPILWSISIVPDRWRWALYLNPMAGVVEVIHDSVLHAGTIDWGLVGLSILATVFLLGFGLFYFRSREGAFADII